MGEHVLRPSDAPRWTACAAAPSFTEDMVETGDKSDADLGTAKHTLAEMLVNMDFAPASTMLGAEIGGFTVNEDFAEQVDWAVAKVKELADA